MMGMMIGHRGREGDVAVFDLKCKFEAPEDRHLASLLFYWTRDKLHAGT